MRSLTMVLFLLPLSSLACSVSNTTQGADPCAALAKKCPLCTDPGLEQTCESAVASGDSASCQSGLDDANVRNKCVAGFGAGSGGSGGSPAAGGAGGSSVSGGNGGSSGSSSGGSGAGGPCEKLAALCPACTDAAAQAACQAAVDAHDPTGCQGELANPDVQNACGASTDGGTGGPCADLAALCPFCMDPAVEAACQGAVAANDPTGCQAELDSADVKNSCGG